MNKITLLIFFLCFSCLVGASEPKKLSFHQLAGLHDFISKDASIMQLKRELSQFHQQNVMIRGFLYKNADGLFILSSEPHLKSCCVGSTEKISQQIFLPNGTEIINSDNAVSVVGQFYVNPEWDENGKLIKLFQINEAQITNENPLPITTIILSVLMCGLVLWLLKLNIRKPSLPEAHA